VDSMQANMLGVNLKVYIQISDVTVNAMLIFILPNVQKLFCLPKVDEIGIRSKRIIHGCLLKPSISNVKGGWNSIHGFFYLHPNVVGAGY